MHKNCCHQSYSFWLRYAPNRLSAGVSLQTPLGSLQHSPRPSSWFRGWGPGEKGRRDEGEKEGGEGKGRDLKCKWISVILVRCGLWCPAGHSARAITFPTLYQWHYWQHSTQYSFVCRRLHRVPGTVLLDLRMIPVSCKMIYLLYLDGQKLGRWSLILISATYCLSLINVTSLLLFTILEQMC